MMLNFDLRCLESTRRRPRPSLQVVADWLLADLDAQPAEIRSGLIRQSLTKPKALVVAVIGSAAAAVIAVAMTAAIWAYAWLLSLLLVGAIRLYAMQAFLKAESSGRHASPVAAAVAGFCYFTIVALGAAGCVLSGQWLLIVISGIGLASLIGGIASRDAGTPRYGALMIFVLIVPYAVATICSPIPYLFMVGLQLPFYACGVIFIMLENYKVLLNLYHSELENRRLAHHDPLTGLANHAQNRKQFEKLLAGLNSTPGRASQPFMVFCLDLDGFKDVNDRYGHSAGDAVLAEVARRLNDSIRALDSVARIGGDEFVILLPAITSQEADVIARRIITHVASAFDIGLVAPVHIGVSIGCARAPDDGDTAEQLLRSADRALYEAKRRGRGVLVHHSALNVVELVAAADTDAALANLEYRDLEPHRPLLPIQSRSVV